MTTLSRKKVRKQKVIDTIKVLIMATIMSPFSIGFALISGAVTAYMDFEEDAKHVAKNLEKIWEQS